MNSVRTEEEALHRSQSIKTGLTYNMYFNLRKGKHFNGIVQIDFELSKTKDLFLDFDGKKILSLQLNSNPKIELTGKFESLYSKGKVFLPEEQLSIGKNSVLVHFINEYNNDGNGLHSFVDTDQKQYIYIQSEPFWLNRVVPVFDQPDLKGTCKFHMLHPNDWVVVSHRSHERLYPNSFDFAAENRIKTDFENHILESYHSSDLQAPGNTLTIFKQSALLSSYLFCFVAGPYKRHDLPEDKRYNHIPMSFYTRESKFKFGVQQSEYMFDALIKSIQFFEKFFGHPFPFEKWDFIMCPEFTVGAMEYPGCVTFNDVRFIFDSEEVPVTNKINTLRVIIHELAHMWFGNMVTMKWWDGLWLNESFADFSSLLCLSQIFESLSFENMDPRLILYARKQWGYLCDNCVTTHAIAGEIEDTNKADSIFDGITYSKGYASLMQLYHLIGYDRFSQNLKNYFEEFKWANTELEDLFRHLSSGIDSFDIQKWMNTWLRTCGTNLLTPQWDASQKGKQTMKILQSSVMPEYPTLRMHFFEMTFFDDEARAVHTQQVTIQDCAVSEVPIDNKGYSAVLLNSTDKDFVQANLDDQSKDFFLSNLWKVETDLYIELVLGALTGMFKSPKIPPNQTLEICLKILNAKLGKSEIIFDLPKIIDHLLKFMPPSVRQVSKEMIFNVVKECVLKTEDKQTLFGLKPLLISSAQSPADVLFLSEVLDDKHPLNPKLAINVRDICQIHVKVLGTRALDQELRDGILKKYGEETLNEQMRNNKFLIDAMLADEKTRKDLWGNVYFNPNRSLSYVELGFSVRGFRNEFVAHALKAGIVDDYCRDLAELLKTEGKEMGKVLLEQLIPSVDDGPDVVAKLESLLEVLTKQGNAFFVDILKVILNDYRVVLKSYDFFE